jgi:hypothetical protein
MPFDEGESKVISEEEMKRILEENYRESTVVCPWIAACLAGALIYALLALFFK